MAEWAIVIAIVSIGVPALIALGRIINQLHEIRRALHFKSTGSN